MTANMKFWLILPLAMTVLLLCPGIAGIAAGQSSDLLGEDLLNAGMRELNAAEENPITASDIESALWTRTFGGDGYDYGDSVQQTSDGGYIITGRTNSFGKGYQVYLIKTKKNGVKQWQKKFGGEGDDEGHSVQQTSDGGYIITGRTNSFGKGYQVYLIKTDSNGVKQWQKVLGGTSHDFGRSVRQTSDGGYIVAGDTISFGKAMQVYLIKTNKKGVKQWQKTLGGDGYDYGRSVRQTADGGYIIAGYTTSFGKGYQVYLVKTDSNGVKQWQKTYGGKEYEYSNSVQQTGDLGYIIAGHSNSFDKGFQVYIVKTNANGKQQWKKIFGGDGWDQGNSVQQTSDGGYIIAGSTDSFGKDYQVCLFKTNSEGVKTWRKVYGGDGSEYGNSVQQTGNGGYIVAGSTTSFGKESQVYLVRTGPTG